LHVLILGYLNRIVTEFVDNILRETASRAVARETPLSYREMRDRWTDMLDKRNAFQQRMGGKHDNSGRQDGHKPAARGGGSKGRGGGPASRSGPAPQSRGAKFQGHNVCYHFNRPSGCKRPLRGTGCENGNNGEYAHVCNFEKAPGDYCLKAHSRSTPGVTH
jgi:hypothetical protein